MVVMAGHTKSQRAALGCLDSDEVRSYAQHISAVREHELRSATNDALYLDAAAAPPAPRSVLDAAHDRLVAGPSISNPHSHSPSGQRTHDDIERARSIVCEELFCVKRRGGIVASSSEEEGWELAFNSGTTAALETVARAFAYDAPTSAEQDVAGPSSSRHGASFAYLEDSHSSLYGLRSVAQSRGTATEHLAAQGEVIQWIKRQAGKNTCSLLALPLQCNATGRRYHSLLDEALEVRQQCEARYGQRRVFILVDAAAHLSPSTRFPLNVTSAHQPDFVAFSFLKVLGYPSGLGGLLLQRRASHRLRAKDYYGGGTLEATSSRLPWRKPMREIPAALEDGTPNLYGILALEPTFRALRSEGLLGSWKAASAYTDSLTLYLHDSLSRLAHCDGSPLIELYSRRAKACPSLSHLLAPALDQGPTVLFNVLRAEASIPDATPKTRRVDPSEIDRLACIEDIHLRSGRMCNVGAVTSALDMADEDIIALWERGIGCGSAGDAFHRKGDAADFDPREEARLQALVSGALRVSLSAWSTYDDVDRLCAFFLKHFRLTRHESFDDRIAHDEGDDFVSCASDDEEHDTASIVNSSYESEGFRHDTQASSQTSHSSPTDNGDVLIIDDSGDHYLKEVYVYPIKSCAAQRVRGPWKLLDTGLEHDRGMCVVDLDTGKVLSQKRIPAMARIRPRIEPSASDIHITFTDIDGKVSAELKVPLLPSPNEVDENSKRFFDMCGTSLEPVPVRDKTVRDTFSHFLGRNCTLARMPLGSARHTANDVPLLLSNESPYLMVTSESVEQVRRWMQGDDDVQVDATRLGLAFRANFVVSTTSNATDEQSTATPFYEDEATHVMLGPHAFTVLGPCRRCEMIALDPVTGASTPKVMSAVARHRRCTHGRLRGRLLFGQHMALRHDDQTHAQQQSLYVREGMAVGLHAE